MHVFVTGATGWVGSAVVRELIEAGHRVSGLVRSPKKAAGLIATGAEIIEGSLDDADVLRTAALAADAVVHTAFDHDFSRFAEKAQQDDQAIMVLGTAMEGSNRRLLVTTGLSGLAEGRAATEADGPDTRSPRKSELSARLLAENGVRASTVRLAPTVHGVGEHGFIAILIRLARDTGVSAYPDDGCNRWAGVHRSDAARLFRLVLERDEADPVAHAVADEGVPRREIAAAIGHGLNLPVRSAPPEHFGWFARFAAADMHGTSERTRARLGWKPTGPGLLSDLTDPDYYAR